MSTSSMICSFLGAMFFLGGLNVLKKAWNEFRNDNVIGPKEKIFRGVLNFLTAFTGRGDSYVFLGLVLCGIGYLLMYYALNGFITL